MKFYKTDPEAGNSTFHNNSKMPAEWQKHRADGKWFWIFKRAAVWLTVVIVLFGVSSFLFPEKINLGAIHIFIAAFMFAGYLLGLLNEWAKMEEAFSMQSFTGE